jgi:putative ABC transport system substrate-binding protein
MSAQAAAAEKGIPVIFSAVSDPLAAGFGEGETENITGVQDKLNFPAQLALIRSFLPEATKIGVMYMNTEANSIAQIVDLGSAIEEYNASNPETEPDFTLIAKGMTNVNEIPQNTTTLIETDQVDCITNLTDNAVAGDAIVSILEKTDEAGIPIFGSEVEQVNKGCLASESLDYVALGHDTGVMAAEVLNGKATSEIPYQAVMASQPYYSLAVAEKLGIAVPDYPGLTPIVIDEAE